MGLNAFYPVLKQQSERLLKYGHRVYTRKIIYKNCFVAMTIQMRPLLPLHFLNGAQVKPICRKIYNKYCPHEQLHR